MNTEELYEALRAGESGYRGNGLATNGCGWSIRVAGETIEWYDEVYIPQHPPMVSVAGRAIPTAAGWRLEGWRWNGGERARIAARLAACGATVAPAD